MEIKTIAWRLVNADYFDKCVNKALDEGWVLENVDILPSNANGNFSPSIVARLYRNNKSEDSDFKEIKVKYFDQEIDKLEKFTCGDWIDLRSAEDVELKAGEYRLIRLGVGMILPDDYEAIIAPRSSTPSKFGVLLSNSIGVIDNSYSGEEDEWKFPALAIRDTHISKGDRICQFRIVKNMDAVKIREVEHLNEVSRGGIGSTGRR